MIVLGINPGYDSTAAVLVDGKVVAVVEEERLSRVKMHLGFPRRAIQEVLRLSGVQPTEVDHVTFSFVEYLKAHPLITRLLLQDGGFPFDPENPVEVGKVFKSVVRALRPHDILHPSLQISDNANYDYNVNVYMRELRRLGINVERLTPVDHHLSHAASAYYYSGFEECLIVTADGSGDGHSLTVNKGKGGKISRIAGTPQSTSPGLFYASITAFLGFKAHRHEGKITGLAAYGDPEKCYEYLIPCFKVDTDTRSLTCDFLNDYLGPRVGDVTRLFSGRFFRNSVMNAYQRHYRKNLSSFSREDIAAAVQKRLEDVFIEYLTPIIEQTKLDKLALAGGVFGNVKLNQRLFESKGINQIFVHPNMGDGGNALGSAFFTYMKHRAKEKNLPVSTFKINDVYFGPGFSDEEIEIELKQYGLRYRRCENIESIVADKLADNQVVGRFNGRMEYGPRALGNRSILANPTETSINTILNKRLDRTEFMPFAPSVLSEDAQTYFDLTDGNLHAAEFMTITCNIHPDKQHLIPAVCHIDGTARPHVVHRAANQSYYEIITEFKKRTGLGVIINTSFNIHEQPIVCTPADACIAFQQNAVDALAIGNFIVDR